MPTIAVLCADAGSGGYQAFPDVCRCANGDLLCVFYAGYDHVSLPRPDLPRGARVCSVRSSDDGRTWTAPVTAIDTPWDDRDPSLTCLRDGTLVLNWFTYYRASEARPGNTTGYKELWLSFSTDHGDTWCEPWLVPNTANDYWGTSSPIIELRDGALVWPIYREYLDPLRCWSATMRSTDGGRTWSDPVMVDPDNDDNDEPALIERPDGSLLCIMRANHGDSMWASLSRDQGRSWSGSRPIGFRGHSPYLCYARNGLLLLGHRLPGTALHVSRDDGESWGETVPLDDCIGAYPSLVNLQDDTVLFVYYQEGAGSPILAQRLRCGAGGVQSIGWTT